MENKDSVNIKRASDPRDADRQERSIDKIREQIEAYARAKKDKNKTKKKDKTLEDELFGNEEI